MLDEKLWQEWNLVQMRCLKLMAKKDLTAALREINLFLNNTHPSDLQSETLAFRGLIREKMGDILSAKEDLLSAHSHSPQATYQRYTIELTIGRLSQSTYDLEDARSWYISAVETAIKDPSTSGASAVKSLLDIKEASSWSYAEKASCEKAIRQAWALFSLSGDPNMENLKETLQILAEASARPIPMARQN